MLIKTKLTQKFSLPHFSVNSASSAVRFSIKECVSLIKKSDRLFHVIFPDNYVNSDVVAFSNRIHNRLQINLQANSKSLLK